MKKSIYIITVLVLALITNAFGQKPAIELTFTAENNGQYVPLDSILIENLTQGGDTTLYTPDTILVLDYITNIENNKTIGKNSFTVSQNYPNPFKEQTSINLYLPENEYIKITVQDILGRELAQYENTLNRGNHSFAFYPGNEKYYLFTVTGKQTSKTIKMLNANGNTTFASQCKIVNTTYSETAINLKSQRLRRVAPALAEKAINNFGFNIGDELKYTACSDIGEISIIDSPTGNQTYTFQYVLGIPCPGTPTVTYEGQVYNTVLIGNQCWLKENLNVGTMIYGSEDMNDDGVIEKYCYYDIPALCDGFGGLYQWDEMMQYTTTPGLQGICPPDWHLPTDDEWKILEGTVDSQYPVGDPEWDGIFYRGYDAGLNLKSKGGWDSGGNGTDEFGFTAFQIGYRFQNGLFYDFGYGFFWSSTMYDTENAWTRYFYYDSDEAGRGNNSARVNGFSVRCIKD